MGILGRIRAAIVNEAKTIVGSLVDIGYSILASIERGIGIKHKPSRDLIRDKLRQQWLELAPGEKEIQGVEWEGEVYYETPK